MHFFELSSVLAVASVILPVHSWIPFVGQELHKPHQLVTDNGGKEVFEKILFIKIYCFKDN